ncbi:MAG: glycosyltransferase family 2 protein [Spirochaetes bacterium]|nr:glycosyltransferase family 2 protein [Spirochaetota bacterium]
MITKKCQEKRIQKIDLLMWTYNSSRTLFRVLSRINEVIPSDYVNRKIAVDGGSDDGTCAIAESLGWEVHHCKKGIPFQANFGLSLVETDYFASFEHDILICDNWLERVSSWMSGSVAVVHGIRLSVNPYLSVLEHEAIMRGMRVTSIDNNLYNTKFIRAIGGFDDSLAFSCDTELRERIENNGMSWVVLPNVLSVHLKEDFRRSAHHFQSFKLVDRYGGNAGFKVCLIGLVRSVPVGLILGFKYRMPLMVLYYMYWRLVKMQTACKVVVIEGFTS